MGPNSKRAVIKALGSLTNAVRALEATRDREEKERAELTSKLSECIDAVSELTRVIGSTVASHTKANAEIIELRRGHSMLEMRLDSLLDRRAANGAAE
jgi:septal ring factor EnvC (AmiA/AmiB activator)